MKTSRTNTQKTINELAGYLHGNKYKLDVELIMYNKDGKYLRGAYNLFRINHGGNGWMKAKEMTTHLIELCEMIQPVGYKSI